MDVTARPILELGSVLLLAAAAGWLARRAHLPAVVRYLAVGLAISPFTPASWPIDRNSSCWPTSASCCSCPK